LATALPEADRQQSVVCGSYDRDVTLGEAIDRARRTAEQLRERRAANEANTKALLIEPLLGALGWDPGDLDAVQREVRVYDGTFLDYALRDEDTARVYVEAKALGEDLTDPKYVSQAINYANNDGVVWCVLTNGLQWRIYKTNESAAMDRKLLAEVNLMDDEPSAEAAKVLSLISHASVLGGDLDAFGDRVFTDGRVRVALAGLAASPPEALLKMISDAVGHPPVGDDALRRSLARILDAPEAPQPTRRGPARPRPGIVEPPRGQEYPIDRHLANKSAVISELFSEANDTAMALGGDVTRRIRKQYIGYFRGKKSFATVELQQRRVLVYLGLKPDETRPWIESRMRNVTNIGHFGMGDVEYSLTSLDEIDDLRDLLQLAYDAAG